MNNKICRVLNGRITTPQSLANVKLHLVFSTKNREPFIHDTVRTALHGYMATVLQNLGYPAVLMNSESVLTSSP